MSSEEGAGLARKECELPKANWISPRENSSYCEAETKMAKRQGAQSHSTFNNLSDSPLLNSGFQLLQRCVPTSSRKIEGESERMREREKENVRGESSGGKKREKREN